MLIFNIFPHIFLTKVAFYPAACAHEGEMVNDRCRKA